MDSKRTYWKADINKDRYGPAKIISATELDGNLIGSRLDLYGGPHAPVLDIDFEASLVPSSTEGHYHLYLDKPMTWRKYKKLLKAFYRAGIIERGYYRSSLKEGMTTVRKPSERKTSSPPLGNAHLIRLGEIRNAFDSLMEDMEPVN